MAERQNHESCADPLPRNKVRYSAQCLRSRELRTLTYVGMKRLQVTIGDRKELPICDIGLSIGSRHRKNPNPEVAEPRRVGVEKPEHPEPAVARPIGQFGEGSMIGAD